VLEVLDKKITSCEAMYLYIRDFYIRGNMGDSAHNIYMKLSVAEVQPSSTLTHDMATPNDVLSRRGERAIDLVDSYLILKCLLLIVHNRNNVSGWQNTSCCVLP